MSKVLTPDEIIPGLLCTVHHWQPRAVPTLSLFSATGTETVVDRAFVGDPLVVEEIDLPFVRVRHLSVWIKGPRPSISVLDTREVTFCTFRAAMLTQEQQRALGVECPKET